MLTGIALYVVNDAVSRVFDVAGLGPEAEEVRAAVSCVGDVVSLLRRVADEVDGRWAPIVREVCFWAEAVVWAEWRGDRTDGLMLRLDRAVTVGYGQMAVH